MSILSELLDDSRVFAKQNLEQTHAKMLISLFDHLTVLGQHPRGRGVTEQMIENCRNMVWRMIHRVEAIVVNIENHIAAGQFQEIPQLIENLNTLAHRYTENIEYFKQSDQITIHDLITAIIVYSCI